MQAISPLHIEILFGDVPMLGRGLDRLLPLSPNRLRASVGQTSMA